MSIAIIIFIIANFINVILNTVKAIVTVKGGVFSASIVNAITFGFYTYIVFLISNGDINIHSKAIIVALVNFVGVGIVKILEKKFTKDKLWVFMCTCKEDNATIKLIHQNLAQFNIKSVYSAIVPNELYRLEIFSNTQKDSDVITALLKKYDIKYSAFETNKNN